MREYVFVCTSVRMCRRVASRVYIAVYFLSSYENVPKHSTIRTYNPHGVYILGSKSLWITPLIYPVIPFLTMPKSISDALFKALDRPDIPKHVMREVYNAVFGGTKRAALPPSYDEIVLPLRAHLASLTSNKHKVRPSMMPLWQEYYDTISVIPAVIKEWPDDAPIPKERKRWQEWTPLEVRTSLSQRFESFYARNPVRGRRIIPFAPYALRAENSERVAKLTTAIRGVRETWNTRGTPTHPQCHTLQGALMLCAARMAERALVRHAQRLATYTAHPYEEPIKAIWQHYLTPEMAQRVRRSIVNPADVDSEGIEGFFKA